jgi:hypothetical protein
MKGFVLGVLLTLIVGGLCYYLQVNLDFLGARAKRINAIKQRFLNPTQK